MVPAPLLASPPETDQVTVAAPPAERVAVNCSTEAPWVLVALQPVQFVSMELEPGAMENVPLEGFPETVPPAQPAKTMRAGARRKGRSR